MMWMKLRRLIDAHFNNEELRTLCFDLGVDYESLGGEGKAGKIRELLAHMRRYHHVDELMHYLRAERPEVAWPEILAATVQEKARGSLGEEQENPVRVAVWNALHRTLWTKKTFLHPYKGRPPLIEQFSVDMWADFINRPIDARPDDPTQILQEIRDWFFSYEEARWRAYLEYILNYWNDLNHYQPASINRTVNAALEREGSPLKYSPEYTYTRFTSGAIVEARSTPASKTFSSPAVNDSRSAAAPDIPDNISEIIYQQAEMSYPDNFSMRKLVIDNEIQAWRNLQAYQAPDVPKETLTLIFQQAEKSYPDKFSMRKSVIDNEIQAWRNLQAYQAPDVPEETLTLIFQQAEKSYPDKFSMRKSVIDNEIQAWRDVHRK